MKNTKTAVLQKEGLEVPLAEPLIIRQPKVGRHFADPKEDVHIYVWDPKEAIGDPYLLIDFLKKPSLIDTLLNDSNPKITTYKGEVVGESLVLDGRGPLEAIATSAKDYDLAIAVERLVNGSTFEGIINSTSY